VTAPGIGPTSRTTARAARVLRYQLNVVASTTEDVVQSAGGWLCDRARAGWDVNVLVVDGGDRRPLEILGATALDLDKGFVPMLSSASRVGAVAVSADVLGAGTRSGRASGELGRAGFQVTRACRRRCFDGCGHTDRDVLPDGDGINPPAVLRLNRAT
jgi:hypothetical protein